MALLGLLGPTHGLDLGSPTTPPSFLTSFWSPRCHAAEPDADMQPTVDSCYTCCPQVALYLFPTMEVAHRSVGALMIPGVTLPRVCG